MRADMGRVHLSVVIPAYNASKYIGECLTSVLAQEEAPPFEVIVVDDGSSDSTADIVAREFPSVHLFRKSNGGPGSARNRGVAEARGEIIVFIDADDVMLPGRLAFQGGFMLANHRFGLTSGNIQYSNCLPCNKMLQSDISEDFDFVEVDEAYCRLLMRNFVATVASAVRREVYISCGGQPEEIFVSEDYAMNCAIAREFPIAVSRRYLTWYRIGHGGNLMSSRYAYCGQVHTLARELSKFSHLLPQKDRLAASKRLNFIANMSLRWLWIERGRGAVLKELGMLRNDLSFRLRLKWFAFSFAPPLLGRGLRWIKRDSQVRMRPMLPR